LGINKNIGLSLMNQRIRSEEKFKQAVLELQEKLMKEGIEISQDEINFLIEKKEISQDATKDMINAIMVLKRSGISLVYTDEKGKTVNTIKQAFTIETMLENYYPKLNEDKKEQIKKELEALGINKNIGQSLVHQRSKSEEKFKQAVLKLQEELKQEGIDLSQEEIESLISSKRTTAQDIGKVSYDAPTAGCDEKQEFMQGLDRTIKERGRAS